MEKIMIVNGSPRAPKSNSKKYAQIFSEVSASETQYFNISKTNHVELSRAMGDFTHVLLVFPLYADGIPVTLLNFLKSVEKNPPLKKPAISVMVNCGFLEPAQNNIALQIVQLFCKENGFSFGSALKIASGEAILSTTFRFLVRRKIKRLASSIEQGNHQTFEVTMPLPKSIFLRASTSYWENYGKKNGVTKEQMSTMEIEA